MPDCGRAQRSAAVQDVDRTTPHADVRTSFATALADRKWQECTAVLPPSHGTAPATSPCVGVTGPPPADMMTAAP